MSELINFTLFYGPGVVRSNALGVDLSEFSSTSLPLADPEALNFREANKWMTCSFSLDPEMYCVSIQALVTKSGTNVNWELIPIESTRDWRGWLRVCKARRGIPMALVQAILKGHEVESNTGYTAGQDIGHAVDEQVVFQQAGEQQDEMAGEGTGDGIEQHAPSGQADEAEDFEFIHGVIDQEDADGMDERMDGDEDSSDDDGGENDPIPAEWDKVNTGGMTVDDGHESRWEYRNNEVLIGSVYRTKHDVKRAVNLWGMSTQRTFRTKVSSPSDYTVVCEATGCQSMVHAHVPKYELHWVVTNVVPHSCVRSNVLAQHRNLTSTLITNLMYSEIIEKKDMEAKHIQIAIKSKYQYEISYGKAWRAKQKAMETRFGSYLDSYDNLPRLLWTLRERNPGTYVDIQQSQSSEYRNLKVLHRAFFAFGACIEALIHCRPVICVDGTFLTDKFKGQILTAIGVDGNNQLLPLAMAFVEGENSSC